MWYIVYPVRVQLIIAHCLTPGSLVLNPHSHSSHSHSYSSLTLLTLHSSLSHSSLPFFTLTLLSHTHTPLTPPLSLLTPTPHTHISHPHLTLTPRTHTSLPLCRVQYYLTGSLHVISCRLLVAWLIWNIDTRFCSSVRYGHVCVCGRGCVWGWGWVSVCMCACLHVCVFVCCGSCIMLTQWLTSCHHISMHPFFLVLVERFDKPCRLGKRTSSLSCMDGGMY